MNPYLVKELRQLTRSKVVSGGIVMLLFGQLLAAALVVPAVLKSGGTEAEDALGAILLAALGGVLGLALCIVLPFLVFGRFVAENPKDRTLVELATAAPPSAVIDGKVQAGLVLAAALVAGSLPFQLLCVALRGVDFVAVLGSCASMLLVCSVQLHFAVRFAASRGASAGRRWAAMVLFQFFFGQYALFGGVAAAAMSVMGAHGAGPSPLWFRGGGGAWAVAFAVAATVSLNLLLRASAVRSLAPPSTDRDRAPRLTLLALWAAWGAVAAGVAFAHSEAAPLAAWAAAFAAALAVSFYGAAGSPRGVPRRVLAERPASRARRWRRAPFSAGFAGGAVFVVALLAATALAALGLALLADAPGVGSADRMLWLRWTTAGLYVLAIPAIVRGIFLHARGGRLPLPLVPSVSFLALIFAQGLPLLGAIGRGKPPEGVPFFLFGVFLCEDAAVVVHLVFAGLAFLGGLAAVEREIASSLRAYLSSPSPASPPTSPPPLPG